MGLLPVYKGYTVDVRLRQFRYVTRAADGTPSGVFFLDFLSDAGFELLCELVSELLPVEEFGDAEHD